MLPLILIVAVGVLLYLAFSGGRRNVEHQIRAGFPEEWDRLLLQHVGFYHVLTPEKKERFRERVHRFILTKPIIGYQTEVDDVVRLLVASSAVMLTLSFERWNFNYLSGVIVTDQVINPEVGKQGNVVLGQVETSGDNSKMVLSKSSLLQGFRNMNDRKNVGVHEFAHVLDHADGEIDGIPRAIMPSELVDNWVELVGKKIKAIYDNHSDFDCYGATSESEFFAVATEYFFEKPDVMKRKHPALYEIMSTTFQQDESSGFSEKLKNLVSFSGGCIGRNAPCPCGSGKKFKRCCMRN
ncbi:MAG: zinc-dependent peptidase [Chitinispirillaceae bacterium]|nr:zinc-dependent peptidase [Chitinispirillaceae bacterium]